MPRTKGSKNKVRIGNVDYAALISDKQAEKDSLAAEIEALEEQVKTIKADLKTKKAAVKKLDKEITKTEAKKAAAEQEAAKQEQKQKAIGLVEKYLAEGMSVEEIENLLK
mgnify:FL=1